MAHASTIAVENDEAHYVAAPGEVNDVVVGHADANTITVRDAGATIEARDGCTAVDAHNARCVSAAAPLTVARVESGDMDDRIRSYGNAPPVRDPSLVADGGAGDDELIGGESPDFLNGGGGLDRMIGAAGADVLTDGDVSGHADADVFIGGPAADTLLYSSRTRPLELNLGDEKTHGESGEGDSLTTMENIVSGSGADRLVGDGFANVLSGGFGADEVSCGRGLDVARVNVRADFVSSDCEKVAFDSGNVSYAARPYPVSGMRFRLGCPTGRVPCSGKLTLREKRGRVLGKGVISRRRSAKPVKVKLTKAGRRLTHRKNGVLAVVTLKGERLPSIGWTIRLRLPG